MFENFSFPSPAAPAANDPLPPPSKSTSPSRPRRQPHSLRPSSDPLTPPLSPMRSPGVSPIDSDSCYTYFDSVHDDPLTSTLASFALTTSKSKPRYASPETSDNECDPLEDVRRKRQSMARMQTDDDLLRQLGELVKKVSPANSGSRKGSTGSLTETSGVVKKRSGNAKSRSSRSKPAKSRETNNGSGRRVAA